MLMSGRKYSSGKYRYGLSGQERSTELGIDSYTAEFWQFDARLARRWNLDPKPISGVSEYAGFVNNPIRFSDPFGDTSVVGAGGRHGIELDDKANKLEFYGSQKYNLTGTNTLAPVEAGQLRAFTNFLGRFSATWSTNDGTVAFVGYKNEKGQDLDAAVKELNEFASSWKFRLWSFGDHLMREHGKDPVGYVNTLMITHLTLNLPGTGGMLGGKGYNPSVVTQESASSLGIFNLAAKPSTSFAEGSFSVFNWKGYPEGGIKPTGPFRLLEGAEYTSARNLANSTNAAIRRANPEMFKGLQIHEIHPVKFGGSPTDLSNKIFLTPSQHAQYTNFWNALMRSTK